MANVESKVFHTRVQLKYDSWERWNSDENKVKVPLAGEVCLVAIPSVGVDGSVPSEAPAVLMKVGDGTTPFKDLKWLSAKAADVHSWAKMSESDFKAWLVSADGPALATAQSVTDAVARIAANELAISGHATRIEELEAALGVGEGTDGSISDRVSDLETSMGTVLGDKNTAGSIAEAKAQADKGVADAATAQAAAEAAQATANANATAIGVLNGDDAGKSVRTIATEAIAAYADPEAAEGTINTLTEILDWMQGVDEGEGGASALIADVNAIQTFLGGENASGSYDSLEAGATVRAAVNENTSRIGAAVARIASLEGMVGEEGSVTKAIADAEKAAKDYADTEIGKAKTELQGYADQAEADALSAAKGYTDAEIDKVEASIATINSNLGSGTVDSRIAAALQSAKDYADVAESDAVKTVVGASGDAATANTVYGAKAHADAVAASEAGKVQAAVNGELTTIKEQLGSGKVDDRIATAKSEAATDAQNKADAALASAKTYADQAEADAISSANGYTDGKVAAINTEISNVKDRPFVSVATNGVQENGDIHYVTFYCGSADVMF